MTLLLDFLAAIPSAQILVSAFLAVLFLQSGLDKVFDFSGNLGWLKGHFAKTPLKSMVPFMLGTITVLELAAGIVSAIGVVTLLMDGSMIFALKGAQLSALSLLMLFFGQRIAKDYEGAATLVGYFLLSIAGIFLFS
ncbi:MAG: DoxX family membrane protein [Bacteroidota bacterium]